MNKKNIESLVEWVYPIKGKEKEIEDLANNLSITKLEAATLYNRGFNTVDKAEKFLDLSRKDIKDPRLMKDAEKGADLIIKHIKEGNKIINFSDFDADGWGSTITFLTLMNRLGADIDYWVNKRSQGFGMSVETVDLMLKKFPDTKLVVSTDNGIVAYEAVDRLKELGIDVIVTDHHQADKDKLPNADAVINPNQPLCDYPFKGLCGAGVIWKVSMLIYEKMGRNPNEVYDLIDVVSLSTVADVVPLVDENRIIVSEGIKKINNNQDPDNIWTLMQETFKNYFDDLNVITSETFGFTYGPAINAMSRMHGTTEFAVDTFLDYMIYGASKEETLEKLEYIKEVNEERKDLSKELSNATIGGIIEGRTTDALCQVVYSPEFTEGIVGIIAGRVKDKFNKPTIIFCDDAEEGIIKGSGRSIEGFPLKDILDEINEETNGKLLIRYGGHDMAAGLSIRKEDIYKLETILMNKALLKLNAEDFVKRVYIDWGMDADKITKSDVDIVKSMEPYGQAFRKPEIGVRMFKVDKVNYIGAGKHHLELINQEKNLKIISWFGAKQYKYLNEPTTVYVVGNLEINNFDNMVTVNVEPHNIVGVS